MTPLANDPNLAKPRTREWFTYDILGRDDRVLFTLSRPRKGSGRIQMNLDAQIRGGGSFGWIHDPAQPEIDPLIHRVRIWQHVVAGGVEMEWPWITGLLSLPTLDRRDGADHRSVSVLDKTSILDEDALREPLSLVAETVVTTAVKTFIGYADPSAQFGITDSALTLRSPMVWPAGTSRLTVVNDLLGAIGYFGIFCDPYGRYCSSPYTLPNERTIARTFEAGVTSVHRSVWSRTQDLTSVPNRCVAISRGGYEIEALVAEANLPDSSRFSAANRGYVRVKVVEGVEAADQATMDRIAQRELAAALTPATVWDVEHASLPLALQDRVLFSPAGMESTTATVRVMALRLQAGEPIKAEWRGVE